MGWLSGVAPWEQFVDTGDFVIGDAAEHIGEPGLGIDTVELGGLDQGIGDGSGFASALRANKKVILAA